MGTPCSVNAAIQSCQLFESRTPQSPMQRVNLPTRSRPRWTTGKRPDIIPQIPAPEVRWICFRTVRPKRRRSDISIGMTKCAPGTVAHPGRITASLHIACSACAQLVAPRMAQTAPISSSANVQTVRMVRLDSPFDEIKFPVHTCLEPRKQCFLSTNGSHTDRRRLELVQTGRLRSHGANEW